MGKSTLVLLSVLVVCQMVYLLGLIENVRYRPYQGDANVMLDSHLLVAWEPGPDIDMLAEFKHRGPGRFPDLDGVPKPTSVAIGLGITSWTKVVKPRIPRKYKKHSKTVDMTHEVTDLDHHVFFTTLMPSFCETASKGYAYNFYLGFDFNDPLFSSVEGLEKGSHAVQEV